jgi:AcrR family transcriptional regulator
MAVRLPRLRESLLNVNVTTSFGVTTKSGYSSDMGLREINAKRTRELIVEAAMSLFFEHGYEATTMEDVADSAGIGVSTLYRYFPTKDQLGTSLLGDPGLMARVLAGRPHEEPTSVALGHAVLAFLQAAGDDPQQAEAFQRLVHENPRLNIRVLEWLMEAHERLADAVAEREGRAPGDLAARASAWMTVFVLQQVGAAQDAGDTRDGHAIASALMSELAARELSSPRL